ncbi:TetR/AcrR family transcriptional regulator [Saccharopolyspora griseoalba]|uniref:TetR/AcrR family transcriptional regulator n=1 Tax=Saccharopolyspora griseoalba TaxID=1431848 RepID=A0ABW2LPI4_9PSEU
MGGKYHHGDLRAELVRVGLELIAERGLDGFSVAEVARRAKVSAAAPYRHFAERESLLAAVAADLARRLADEVAEAAEAHDDVAESLAAAAGAYTASLIGRRAGMELINAEALQGEQHAELHDQVRRLTDQFLLRCLQIAPAPEALELMEQLFTQAHGYGTFWLNGVFTKHGYTPDLVVRKSTRAARIAVAGHQVDDRP